MIPICRIEVVYWETEEKRGGSIKGTKRHKRTTVDRFRRQEWYTGHLGLSGGLSTPLDVSVSIKVSKLY